MLLSEGTLSGLLDVFDHGGADSAIDTPDLAPHGKDLGREKPGIGVHECFRIKEVHTITTARLPLQCIFVLRYWLFLLSRLFFVIPRVGVDDGVADIDDQPGKRFLICYLVTQLLGQVVKRHQ